MVLSLTLELLKHDSESLGSSTDLRVVVASRHIDGSRLAVLDPDKVDRRQHADLDTPSSDLSPREEPVWSKVLDELIILINHDDSVVDRELVPIVESLGRLAAVSTGVLGDGGGERGRLASDEGVILDLSFMHEFWNGVVVDHDRLRLVSETTRRGERGRDSDETLAVEQGAREEEEGESDEDIEQWRPRGRRLRRHRAGHEGRRAEERSGKGGGEVVSWTVRSNELRRDCKA